MSATRRVLLVVALLLVCAPAHGLSGMAMKALCGGSGAASGSKADAAGLKATGDRAFARRNDVKQARAAIKAYEASLAADPGQADVRLRASRTWYLLGDGHYRFEEEDDKQLEAFMHGARHAAAAVALTAPRFRSLICSGSTVAEAIATLDARAIPAIYWFATNLGKYGLAKDLIELLANKDMIFGVMNAARRIYPTYFHGAPDRYLGAYYTKVPFPKGDLPKSLRHFRVTMRGARDYFATYVLVAQMYTLKVKDRVPDDARYCRIGSPKAAKPAGDPCRRLFKRLLEHVIKTPAKVLPAIEAEQRVEQRKAKALLEEIDTYFPPKSTP